MVLVHGSMDRASSFRRVLTRLEDCTVLSYDRRGYAGSVDCRPTEVFSQQVDDLLEVLAGRTAVGVGHSMGGDVVLAAAQRRPDLIDTAAVFEPPQPWLESWTNNSAGIAALGPDGNRPPPDVAETFMKRMIGVEVWDRLPAATRRQRRAEGPALVADLRSLRLGPPPFDPAAVTIPVVCGYGARSRPHQQEGTRLLAGRLPRGELVEVEGSSHGAHLSHPDHFAALIRRALERRGQRALPEEQREADR